MAYLVMLVTVLAIMHGIVHPYPRNSANQQTKSNFVCYGYGNPDAPVGSNKTLKITCKESGPKEIPVSNGSVDFVKNEKRVEVESVKSKLDRYNKKWRLPRIENEELQTVFIIGTDDY